MHILRSRAIESDARDQTPMPKDATYDVALGAWHGKSGYLAYDPDTDRTTKKQDIETGEDQKGQ